MEEIPFFKLTYKDVWFYLPKNYHMMKKRN